MHILGIGSTVLVGKTKFTVVGINRRTVDLKNGTKSVRVSFTEIEKAVFRA